MAERPASATGALTGIAGTVALGAGALLLRDWLQPGYIKALAVLGISAATMILVDIVVYHVESRGLEPGAQPLDWSRLGRKLLGVWLTLLLAGSPYWLVPGFDGSLFQPFRQAVIFLLPGLVIVVPLYVVYVDRRQRGPEDIYAQLGGLVLGRPLVGRSELFAHMRGWAIKAFFLPLMFGYVAGDLGALWSTPLVPSPLDFEHIFPRVLDGLYLIDVCLAAIAYVLTLRALDTHIRSAEPVLSGWVACLLCYPPFNDITGRFLPYDQDGVFWGQVFAPYPAIYVLWGGAILLLVGVYACSTAAFGLRFSNLTHRGIITRGPYRWSKHPAYVAKNLSWWMISVPFVAGAGWAQAVQSCLLLGGVNVIYFLRAKAEERHLSTDPAYQLYAQYIAEHGALAAARKLARWVRLSLAVKLRAPA